MITAPSEVKCPGDSIRRPCLVKEATATNSKARITPFWDPALRRSVWFAVWRLASLSLCAVDAVLDSWFIEHR